MTDTPEANSTSPSNNAGIPSVPAAPADPVAPVAAIPAAAATTQTGMAKPTITYDDFVKLDLKVGKIMEASAHPNADKLVVLKVDLGTQQRQIIAGIKGHYAPEALVGQEIVVVANLAPRKMRGLESQGMLLAASSGDGESRSVVIICPQREVPPGSNVS